MILWSFFPQYVNKVKVEATVEIGDPRDLICEMVEKCKPDFLVLGSHGYGAIKR